MHAALTSLVLVGRLLSPATWEPETLAYVAAMEVGEPAIAPALVGICWRESRCSPVAVHEGDAHLSRRGWRSQVRLGHLDPTCQPYARGQWATRGAWGLSAASHWSYLPACYQPAALDDLLTSARVAARKYIARCRVKKRSSWCESKRGPYSSQRAALAEFGLQLVASSRGA
jgi:hypothetical protein